MGEVMGVKATWEYSYGTALDAIIGVNGLVAKHKYTHMLCDLDIRYDEEVDQWWVTITFEEHEKEVA